MSRGCVASFEVPTPSAAFAPLRERVSPIQLLIFGKALLWILRSLSLPLDCFWKPETLPVALGSISRNNWLGPSSFQR